MTSTDFRPKGIREPALLAVATCALVVLMLVVAACGSGGPDNPQAPEACPDLNGDNLVDKSDIEIVDRVYGSRQGDPDYDPFYDLNHDGFIDQTDISLAGSQFGKACTR